MPAQSSRPIQLSKCIPPLLLERVSRIPQGREGCGRASSLSAIRRGMPDPSRRLNGFNPVRVPVEDGQIEVTAHEPAVFGRELLLDSLQVYGERFHHRFSPPRLSDRVWTPTPWGTIARDRSSFTAVLASSTTAARQSGQCCA